MLIGFAMSCGGGSWIADVGRHLDRYGVAGLVELITAWVVGALLQSLGIFLVVVYGGPELPRSERGRRLARRGGIRIALVFALVSMPASCFIGSSTWNMLADF